MIQLNQQSLVETFTNTKTHEEVAEIIYSHSTNKLDVRMEALDGLKLQNIKTALDLGCGFGFFTRSLKNRLPLKANILGLDQCTDYRSPFLNSCNIAGIKGSFRGAKAEYLQDEPTNSYDLIICSYALYFFPEITPQISRILKPEGVFVTITHSSNHLFELFTLIKNAFKTKNRKKTDYLPYEKLISKFCNINGREILSPYFDLVKEKEYCSSLIFEESDAESIEKYLMFKRPFYVPGSSEKRNMIYDSIIKKIAVNLRSGIPFKITKDDTIYICYKPILTK